MGGDVFSRGGYYEVSRLVVRDLDEAYRMMQDCFMPEDIREYLQRLVYAGHVDHISMSVGDCLVWGDTWMCDMVGWRRIRLV